MAMNAELPDAFASVPPLAGEGAPAFLVVALAAMGAALAVVSASLWLAPPMAPAEPVTIVVRGKAPPPKIIKVPVPAPPKIIKVPAKPAPPPCFTPVTFMFATGLSVPMTGTDADRTRLNAGIARLRKWLSKHNDAKLVIEGHADKLGPEEINLMLSFARAKAVSTILVSDGIPADRMTVRAAGAEGADVNIDPRDRRVDVSIEGVSTCKSASGATEQP
jgi:hypothetical protein